jgi:hypothetical protein
LHAQFKFKQLGEIMNEYNGQEQWGVGVESADDVMNILEHRGIDDDGLTWLDWHNRLERGDALHNIVQILVKNRRDPKYAELISEIEAEIEGWL